MLSLPPALPRGGAIGGGVVCCRWPLMCHVGARRVRVSADARVEWSERRGGVVRREMRERRDWGLGVGAVAAAGVVALRARRYSH